MDVQRFPLLRTSSAVHDKSAGRSPSLLVSSKYPKLRSQQHPRQAFTVHTFIYVALVLHPPPPPVPASARCPHKAFTRVAYRLSASRLRGYRSVPRGCIKGEQFRARPTVQGDGNERVGKAAPPPPPPGNSLALSDGFVSGSVSLLHGRKGSSLLCPISPHPRESGKRQGA